MSKIQTRNEVVSTMSIAELQSRAERAKALFAQLEELLPGLVTMTEDDRRHSEGTMRTGEPEALASVIDVAEKYPQYFAVLADKDRGVDPRRFETELLRDHLARRTILGSLLATAEAVTTRSATPSSCWARQFVPLCSPCTRSRSRSRPPMTSSGADWHPRWTSMAGSVDAT